MKLLLNTIMSYKKIKIVYNICCILISLNWDNEHV